MRAPLFHAGPLCGVTHFDAQEGRGFLHVLRRGEMVVTHRPRSGAARKLKVAEPALLPYPRPLEQFKLQLGATPAGYLLQWRMSLAQSMLLAGSSIKLASEKLGYASAASFSRAFAQSVGLSPRAWLQVHEA